MLNAWGVTLTLSPHTADPETAVSSQWHPSVAPLGAITGPKGTSGSFVGQAPAWLGLCCRTCYSGLPCQTSAYLFPEELHLYCSASLFPRSSVAAVLTGAQAKTGYPVGEVVNTELRL